MDANLRNSVDEVHRHIIACAHATMDSVIEKGTINSRKANELMIFAMQLSKLLPDPSKPSWLTALIQQFDGKELSAFQQPNSASEFARFIFSNIPYVETPILSPDEVNYDFDIAFHKVREDQGIPPAFDILVSKLEEIIATDLIDSRVVQQALERLMALLKRNKHGSLTSILVSLHYGRFALKAFGGALKANKYLKPLVEAFQEEFSIAERKVQTAEATLKKEAIRRLINQERLFEYIEQKGEDRNVIAGYLGQHEPNPNAPK
jgi:hypothetical protein